MNSYSGNARAGSTRGSARWLFGGRHRGQPLSGAVLRRLRQQRRRRLARSPPGADFNDKLLINGGAARGPLLHRRDPGPACRFRGPDRSPGIPRTRFEESAFGAANGDRRHQRRQHLRHRQADLADSSIRPTSAWPTTTARPRWASFDTYEVVNDQSSLTSSRWAGPEPTTACTDMVITDDGADRYMLNQGGGFVAPELRLVRTSQLHPTREAAGPRRTTASAATA